MRVLAEQLGVVYWLYGSRCRDPFKHGYIGISNNFPKRVRDHRKDERFPAFKAAILFTATIEDCLDIESDLRPSYGIGWNFAAGGWYPAETRAPETRKKMRAKALKRYADEKERERTSAAVKGTVDNRGPKNPMFGRKQKPSTIKKIRAKKIGRGIGNQNWRKRKPFSPTLLRIMSEASIARWDRARRNPRQMAKERRQGRRLGLLRIATAKRDRLGRLLPVKRKEKMRA